MSQLILSMNRERRAGSLLTCASYVQMLGFSRACASARPVRTMRGAGSPPPSAARWYFWILSMSRASFYRRITAELKRRAGGLGPNVRTHNRLSSCMSRPYSVARSMSWMQRRVLLIEATFRLWLELVPRQTLVLSEPGSRDELSGINHCGSLTSPTLV